MPRPGRIRKKSSKFADFESPDEIEGQYNNKKKGVSAKGSPKKVLPLKIENSDSDDSDSDDSDSDIDMKEDSMSFNEDWGENVEPGDMLDDYKEDDFDTEGNLQVDEGSKDGLNYATQGPPLYLSGKKKPSLKDIQAELKQKNRKKSERKDKGKARFTAYMLWARAMRPKIVDENPIMDFAAVNKRLGEMWNMVPYTQKHNWKRQAKKLEARGEKKSKPGGRTMITTGKSNSTGMISTGRATSSAAKPGAGGAGAKSGAPSRGKGNKGGSKGQVSASLGKQNTPSSAAHRQNYHTPKKTLQEPPAAAAVTIGGLAGGVGGLAGLVDGSPPAAAAAFKVTGTSPIDVSAHLKLLGESLNNIGQKLKEHEGQIAVSGSLSVLLDSMLCVLGPLACLSNQLPETRGAISDKTLGGILDNIAYIMPGIV